MGQQEVINFLKNKREYTDDFFTAKEIVKGLQESHNIRCSNIYSDLMRLVVFNMIEWKGKGLWTHKKVFRFKIDKKV
jgi:hypothetical protein